MRHDSDIIIIGAGVVGCAIARELSLKHPEKKIIVLDKLNDVGLETSSKNSGVLHSGIHQNPNFLKSHLAEDGSKLAAKYAKEKHLSILDSGMLIVVSFRAINRGLYRELRQFLLLRHIFKNGKRQGIKVKIISPFKLKKMASGIRALGGIFIPDVWVVDSLAFTQSLEQDAQNMGVKFYFHSPVMKIRKQINKYEVFTDHSWFSAPVVINSAGLYADDVAGMAGFNEYKIYPWRGEYYEVLREKAKLVNRLIYPVVDKKSPSKGMHFSPRVDGRLFVGPNARLVPEKNYYLQDKTPVEVFVQHIQKYIPSIEAKDLRWAYSGIRPKTTPGAEESDFIINVDSKNPTFVNLIGIESPGLASSMAIAKYVHKLLKTAC